MGNKEMGSTELLMNVGLDYLALSRSSKSLSGGEAQRTFGWLLNWFSVGWCFVLDEPSIGLHQRDNENSFVRTIT
jgi:excinuclease ABC subunit A